MPRETSAALNAWESSARKYPLRVSAVASGRGRPGPETSKPRQEEADGEADGSGAQRPLSSEEPGGDGEHEGRRQQALGNFPNKEDWYGEDNGCTS